MRTLLRWLTLTLVVMGLGNIMSTVSVDGFVTALAAALVLGLVMTLLKPIISLVAFPLNLITFGLFGLVINAGLILLAASIVPGFVVAGFWAAVLFGFLFSIISTVVSWVF